MAFKSHAQRKHFEEKLAKGHIDQKTFDSYAKGTPEKIPHRVTTTSKPTEARGPRSIPKPHSIEELRKLIKTR